MVRFNLECSKCKKNLWRIAYDPNKKETAINCAGCGQAENYENVIGVKRRVKNVKKTRRRGAT